MGWLNATDAEKNIAEFAWRLLNDCYLTSLCVKHRPDLLALAVCYISLRVHNVKVELEEHAEKPWWKVSYIDLDPQLNIHGFMGRRARASVLITDCVL